MDENLYEKRVKFLINFLVKLERKYEYYRL